MGEDTTIKWTDSTFNPWIGCTKVSPACDHCYAEGWDTRYFNAAHWGPKAPRHPTKTWRSPTKWNREAEKTGIRHKVFCASRADVADNHPSIQQSWRDDLSALVLATPCLDWQFLTKRPQNLTKFYSTEVLNRVWLGTTIENQKEANRRITILRQIRARVRWLSVEPLLEYIDLDLRDIDWIVIGGESGADCRPMDLAWLQSVIAQCRASGVPVFVKQDSAFKQGQQGRISDVMWALKEFPYFFQ